MTPSSFCSMGLDFRLACRSMLKQPSLTAAVVMTIGLAVAANTALFSVFDGLLFRPLPYQDAERIVHVQLDPSALASLSRTELGDIIERVKATTSLVDRTASAPAPVFDPSLTEVSEWQLRVHILGAAASDLLGARPFLGRMFVEQDSKDSPFAVLLGYDVWRTRFGSDPSVVGRYVDIPGASPLNRWLVVGVMPPGFSFPDGANFWLPFYPFFEAPPVPAYGRIAPGVTLAAVRAELPHVVITPLRERVRPAGAFALGVLLIGTALLLLVAWVQIAALLFARATGRVAEIGVRLALGASRVRLVRQFAIEGGVLVLLALALAAVATPALTTLVVDVLPPEITLGQQVQPAVRSFVFAAVLSALGLLVLTILPMDLIRRSSPIGLLRGGLVGDLRLRATRFRQLLFIGQLAVATALVYLAGLALHSFVNVSEAHLGFEPNGLVAIRLPRAEGPIVPVPGQGRARFDRHRELTDQTMASLRQLTGVVHVSASYSWPLQRGGLGTGRILSESDPARRALTGRYASITMGYPETLGVSLITGAEPSPAELGQPGARLALVNETLARHLARFGPVVNQIVARNAALRFRVVGVIPDVILDRVDQPVEPTVFGYLAPTQTVGLVVLARLEHGRTAEQVGIPNTLERIWGQHAPRPFTLDETIRIATGDFRARTLLLGLIAVLCVPLTVIGVAGALRYATAQRTREIAIELAIGAEPRAMERRVVRQAITAAAIALVGGLAVGVGIARIMSATLFGIGAVDPTAIAASSVLVLSVAWVSALLPARRAGRISPAEALRES